MGREKIGFIFPAFAMGFAGQLRAYQDILDDYLARASRVVPLDPERFRQMAAGSIEDELQAHYFCYINSCIVSTALGRQGITSDYVAGYSMGLFAGLFHADVVGFEDGLLLMHNVYTTALGSIDDKRYGMGVIVGMSCADVEKLIAESGRVADVIDVSNEHVVNITGLHDDVVEILKSSAGRSLSAKMLPITLPYHSRFMRNAPERIQAFLSGVELRPPAAGIVSCVNQKVLLTAADIREELHLNVRQRIHWLGTMQKMIALGVRVFVECGMSVSLTKLSKFIAGDYQVYNVKNFAALLNRTGDQERHA